MAKKDVKTEVVKFPEVGTIEEKALRKHYKSLTDEELDEWMAIEGLQDQVKVSGNLPIDRMRKCMAITNKHFPRESVSKPKSKYAQYTTEQLVEMAMENDLTVKDDKGDVRILRMYTVMALKEAGILE